jgi:hypothetical protein
MAPWPVTSCYSDQYVTLYYWSQSNVASNEVAVPARPPRFPRAPRTRPKADSNRAPPVLVEDASEEPFPLPPPVAWATREWRARRLSASRRHLPLRSRPGAALRGRKPGFPTAGP